MQRHGSHSGLALTSLLSVSLGLGPTAAAADQPEPKDQPSGREDGTNERASNTLNEIFNLGKLPLDGSVQAYYNVRSDESATLGRWQARVQLAFLFPSGGSKPKPPEKEGAESGASALLSPAPSPPRAQPPRN